MAGFIKRLIGAASLVLGTLATLPAHAGPYSSMFVFGDSLSDTGSLQILSNGAFPNPADGPYLGGRFSDGLVWVEGLASKLGVANDSKSWLLGGKNYAVAGARLGTGASPPGVLAQLGGIWAPAAGSADPNALYVLVGGGNDMRDARTQFGGITAADDLGRQTLATAAAAKMVQGLFLLAQAGAKHVLISNLPDLGNTPEAFLLGSVAASRDATARFNAQIAGVAAAGRSFGLDIDILDLAGVSAAVVTDALTNGGAKFGITNVSAPCTGFAFSAALGGSACAVSLFSDALHPSAAAFAIIAQAAFDLVPEPAGLALVLTALGALVLSSRRRVAMA